MADKQTNAPAAPEGDGPSRAEIAERLAALRAWMKSEGLDGLIVSRADPHRVESLPANAERLAWLTGFTGSAGMVSVLAESAALFVDGRYTLQARDQMDLSLFDVRHVTEEPWTAWVEEQLPQGGRIGFDPWLHTAARVQRISKEMAPHGFMSVPLASNPIDHLWQDRPPAPVAPIVPHDEVFAGQSSASKRAEIGEDLRAQSVDAAVVTSTESIAWLFNIRGGDVPNTPLALSFALLHADGTADLFVDDQKLSAETRAHLGNAIRTAPYDGFASALESLAAKGTTLLADLSTVPAAVADIIERAGGKLKNGHDPCIHPRAIKNRAEIDGTRNAHARDAVAVAKFLHWLDQAAPTGTVDEIAAERKLTAFRAEGQHYREPSFDTISGAGPNGAIVHYRVTEQTNRKLEPGSFYLVDSGAQYLDGTTDVTRTIAVGPVSAEMRRHFTLVLKGHIALSTARFPVGTTGSQLDTLARMPLWQAGLDYDHGTGHGVGSYLSVHEGPQRISKLPSRVALKPGMILSNEPGFYREGAYGIRIENLVLVTEAEPVDGGERPMLGFEVLTFAPIDKRAIEAELLTPAEIAWLDDYHSSVRQRVEQLVEGDVREWLIDVTNPLSG